MNGFFQTMYSNPVYIIGTAVVVALALLTFYIIRTRGSRKAKKVKVDSEPDKEAEAAPGEMISPESEEGEVNALVHDVRNRAFGLRYVRLQVGKAYGRQWHYLNHLVYWLCLGMNGVLTPIVPPDTLDHSPTELYEALETKDDTYTVLGPQNKALDKIRLGLIVLAACVALFLMYLANKGE